MKLVVGFGNPEAKYNFTRHNFGFLALDFYFKLKGYSWEKTPKFDAIWTKKKISDKDVIFIKPQTYYNDIGKSVAAFSRFYKVKLADILVICDDFNLEFGKLRYRAGGSAGGNNGLKSVTCELGFAEFPRLRLGTGNAALRSKIGDTNFVLGKFTEDEKAALPDILKEVTNRLDELL